MAETNLNCQAVGVFDSGVGGLSVLAALLDHLPHERFDFVADERYLPYGDKPQHEISDRVLTLSHWLHNRGCKAMVMACNTATAAAAGQARATYANWPIVGMEPAVKPASLMTRTGVVGILATTNTVASARFKNLVERYEPLARVIAKPCPGLVELIETCPLPQTDIENLLEPLVHDLLNHQADVIERLALGEERDRAVVGVDREVVARIAHVDGPAAQLRRAAPAFVPAEDRRQYARGAVGVADGEVHMFDKGVRHGVAFVIRVDAPVYESSTEV